MQPSRIHFLAFEPHVETDGNPTSAPSEQLTPVITTPQEEPEANFEIPAAAIAVSIREISKVYRIWSNPAARLTGSLLEVGKRLLGPRPKKAVVQMDESHSRSYRDFHALQNISFDLNKGESLGVIGLNGSGKSTLLQIVAGTLQASEGQVLANGKIAALLELGSGFSPEFTGKENVYLNASLFGLSRQEIGQKYDEIVSFADVGEFIDQPVKTFSSGMIVRLAFAVIAHVDADILLIDEALAVGDARFQAKCFRVLDLFREQGKTIVFVSHDVNSVARLCSSAVLLHQGKVHAIGRPGDVINEYSKILVQGESGPPSSEKLKLKQTTTHAADNLKSNASEKVGAALREALLAEEHAGGASSENEFAYGGEKGEIRDIRVHNEKGQETTVLASGELFDIQFLARAFVSIAAPIYAMIIRDSKGQQIYGQNTFFARVPTEDLQEGNVVEVRFRQSVNLGSGDYLVSLGFTRFEGEQLQVIHRRYDALEIKVVNQDGSIGIANCFSSIEFKTFDASD